MARGRKPIPAEIKVLKGNPGKRRLAIAGKSDADQDLGSLKTPEFLTGPDEKKVFRLICDELALRRFVRTTDIMGLARWASYMAKWIRATKDLGRKKAYYETKSRHGSLLRVHPLHVIIRDMERLLLPLEDRLGLNPAARQTILKGMMPGAGAAADLFPETKAPAPSAATPAESVANDPLGFLGQTTRH